MGRDRLRVRRERSILRDRSGSLCCERGTIGNRVRLGEALSDLCRDIAERDRRQAYLQGKSASQRQDPGGRRRDIRPNPLLYDYGTLDRRLPDRGAAGDRERVCCPLLSWRDQAEAPTGKRKAEAETVDQ